MNLKELLNKHMFKRLTSELIEEIVEEAEKEGKEIVAGAKIIKTSKGNPAIVMQPEISFDNKKRPKAVVSYPEQIPPGRRPDPGEDDTQAIVR